MVEISLLGSEGARVGNCPGYPTMARSCGQIPLFPSESEATRLLSGMPSWVIAWRLLLAGWTSTRCPSKVRLRILRPMIVLYRKTVFSTRLRLL